MTRKTAVKTAVPKIPQPHGGALYAGGVPGNAGGSGRLPSLVRAAALDGAAQAIPKLVAHLDNANPNVVQGAADKLLKYGLGLPQDNALAEADVRERLIRTIQVIRRLCPADLAQRIISQMKEEWT